MLFSEKQSFKWLVLPVMVVVLTCAIAATDSTDTVTVRAYAFGDPEQQTREPDGTCRKPFIKNGDFLVTSNAPDQTVGDGLDEFIIWNFDFSEDPGYCAFLNAGGELTGAVLTVSFKRMARRCRDAHQAFWVQGMDISGWDDLKKYRIPYYERYPWGKWVAITYDLLGTHDPEKVLQIWYERFKGVYGQPDTYIFHRLSDTREGDLPMIFRDDIILIYASMELTRKVK